MSNLLGNDNEDTSSEAITHWYFFQVFPSLSKKAITSGMSHFAVSSTKDKHMNQMTLLDLVHSPQACLHINSKLRVEAKCFLME